jgi:hypothetical protein
VILSQRRFPAAMSNEVVTGGPWADVANATATDGTPTTNNTTGLSDRLVAKDFGFTVPDGQPIVQVSAIIRRKYDGFGLSVVDEEVRIIVAGVTGASNFASGESWPTSYQTKTYNITEGSLVAADVRHNEFGVLLSCELTDNGVTTPTAEVDSVEIEVFYGFVDDIVPALMCGAQEVMTPMRRKHEVVAYSPA